MDSAITLSSSFWISCETYLSVFFSIQAMTLGSPSARSFSNCVKFESLSSRSPRNARPYLDKYLKFDRIFNRQSLLSSFCFLWLLESSSPTSLQVEGKTIITSNACLWLMADSWALKAIVASFQLENPFVRKPVSLFFNVNFWNWLPQDTSDRIRHPVPRCSAATAIS